MVTDPTLYSVTIAAIAFCGFSMMAIIRTFHPPQTEPQPTIALVLPEPPRPIGLLSAGFDLPLPVAPPMLRTAIARPLIADETPTAIGPVATQAMIAGLLAMPETKSTTPAIAPLPMAPVSPPLYHPILMDGVTRLMRSVSSTIPNPWEPESDRYWDQNNTITYPNLVPTLAGSTA